MTKRRRLSRIDRIRIFDAARGLCHCCKLKIQVGQKWDVEHIIPLYAGGPDELSNMAPAHKRCHIAKTSGEAGERSKTTRMRANHLGIPKPRKAKLPAGRDSKIKKTFGRGVVARPERYAEHKRVMAGRTVG